MTTDDKSNLVQDLLDDKIGRRDFLVRAGMLGVSLSGAASILQACGGGGSGSSNTLKFANWASAESFTRDHIDKALAVFAKENNVKVENIAIPFDLVLQQLTTMINGGNPPDVMQLSGNWPYALGEAGTLADLGPFVDQGWRHDAFPNSFEVGTYKGTLYAVPFSITPHGFWYSKDLMTRAGLDPTKPPQTINELNQAMAVLRVRLPADAYPIGIDISKTEYALIGFWPWIWAFGGNPMVDDGKGNVTINWADDGTVAAFQWLQDLVKKRWTPPDQAIKAERELMANGKIAFKLDGPYLRVIFANTNPALSTVQAVNNNFGVTTTPVMGSNQSVTAADIHNLGMSVQTQDKQLAWRLIEFLTTSKEIITSFLIPVGGILPHRSYNTTGGPYAEPYSDPINQAFINKVIPTMRPPAYGPRYSTTAGFIVSALQEIAGGGNVKRRLTRLTDEVKTFYS